eukprot:CAMPEP_0175008502 /NCGR_PEP_ID=MMETSP0005-20121125/7011_1 /TAXON_ID=420556 /ORGANISM="Ochromonas sp., Strain CCMP1393" /LENGTH=200 /DNA_ID=CAMNT_0016264079 /DNA_START=716 /DNA_END=1318 /DNA_ORIENTATION=-
MTHHASGLQEDAEQPQQQSALDQIPVPANTRDSIAACNPLYSVDSQDPSQASTHETRTLSFLMEATKDVENRSEFNSHRQQQGQSASGINKNAGQGEVAPATHAQPASTNISESAHYEDSISSSNFFAFSNVGEDYSIANSGPSSSLFQKSLSSATSFSGMYPYQLPPQTAKARDDLITTNVLHTFHVHETTADTQREES